MLSIRPEHAPSSRLRDGERQRARRRVSRPPGNGPARTGSQRRPRVVSIRPDVADTTSARFRWSSSGHARGTSVVAAYRDHPATAQRGPTPSDSSEWSRSVGPRLVPRQARRLDQRYRWSSSGDGERQRARRCVSRPPRDGSARANPQRQPRMLSIRPEHAPSSRLRATRPAMSPAGRVAATASASELVAAYRDHPATAQREPAPSVGLEWSRPPPAPSSRRRLLDQRVVRHRSGVRGRRRSASRGGGRRGGRPARGRRRSRTRCARSATAGSPTGAARPTCG